MNRAEKVERLQAKAADLQKWFEGRELPETPIKINAWSTITNMPRYMDLIKNTFTAYHANPMAAPYVAAYFQLNNLKNFIENGL